MRTFVVLLAAISVAIACASVGTQAQDGSPAIQDFRFNNAKVRQGDIITYSFAYKNFPGGLAAVKGAEMWVHWQRAGDRPVRSRFVPKQEELAKHATESGSFESRPLKWQAPEAAPMWGVDVAYTLKFTLTSGKEVEASATIKFE